MLCATRSARPGRPERPGRMVGFLLGQPRQSKATAMATQTRVMTTTDSNLWGGATGHTYTFTRQPNSTTDVDAVVVRDGKNFKERMFGFVLGIFGARVLAAVYSDHCGSEPAGQDRRGDR